MPSIFPSSVVPEHQPTCLPNSGVNYNRGNASGLPEETNGIGYSKTTETEARSELAAVDACRVPG